MSGYYHTIEPIRDPQSADELTRFSEETADAIEAIERRGREGMAQAAIDWDTAESSLGYPVFVAPIDLEMLEVLVTVNASVSAHSFHLFQSSTDGLVNTTWFLDGAYTITGGRPTAVPLPEIDRVLRPKEWLALTLQNSNDTPPRRYLLTFRYREIHRGFD